MNIIIKNKNIIKLYKFLVEVFKFLNKYLYILSIISLIKSIFASLRENKLYLVISWIIKILLFINILVGTGFIIYFTDLVNPFNNTFSFYSDILKPYFDFLKKFWNDLINFNIEDSISSKIRDNPNIKNQIKDGIKEGVKEAFNEILEEMQDKQLQSNTNSDLLKQAALISSVLFFGYFLFILPGPSISPEDLTQFNWMNQSLIEIKIVVKDMLLYLFSNPSDPGNNGIINSPISPISSGENSGINKYFTSLNSTVSPISPSNSVMSEGLSTVTPNTPKVLSKTLTHISTQTNINGNTVSKMVETVNILNDVLGEEESKLITDNVNKVIKNITD